MMIGGELWFQSLQLDTLSLYLDSDQLELANKLKYLDLFFFKWFDIGRLHTEYV